MTADPSQTLSQPDNTISNPPSEPTMVDSTGQLEGSGHDSSLSLSIPPPENPTALAGHSDHSSGIDGDDILQVDEDELLFDDNDSALGGSLVGYDTHTISSYITDYRYENGRRYHAYRDGEYWGPNDEPANEQQDIAHHMYLMTLEGKIHCAPLINPQNVLDVGTGNGNWAIEMADAYPSAHVIGTDLSPIQSNFVPPNCAFEIEDLNSQWTYPKDHFDFIHIRELFGCVPDWDDFFKQAFTHTKPGGYVEIMEHSVWPVSDDGTVNENSFFTLWGKTVVEMGDKFGKGFEIWKESKSRLEKAGFVDIVEERYKWPLNEWPSPEHRTHGNDGGKGWRKLRELGIWNQLRLHNGVEGFMIRLLTVVGGWSYESAQQFLGEMQAALMDLKVHAYLDVSVVYGRKPEVAKDLTDAPMPDQP